MRKGNYGDGEKSILHINLQPPVGPQDVTTETFMLQEYYDLYYSYRNEKVERVLIVEPGLLFSMDVLKHQYHLSDFNLVE